MLGWQVWGWGLARRRSTALLCMPLCHRPCVTATALPPNPVQLVRDVRQQLQDAQEWSSKQQGARAQGAPADEQQVQDQMQQ